MSSSVAFPFFLSTSTAATFMKQAETVSMSELRPVLPVVITTTDEVVTTTTTTIRGTTTIAAGVIRPSRETIRKELFGPTNHDENRKLLQQELNQISNQDMVKWNFNFKDDKPIEGRFDWEEISTRKVPSAYDMLHLQGACSSSAAQSSFNNINNKNISVAINSIPSTSSSSKRSRALNVKNPELAIRAKACRNLSFTELSESEEESNKEFNPVHIDITKHDRLSPDISQCHSSLSSNSNNSKKSNNGKFPTKSEELCNRKAQNDPSEELSCSVIPRLQHDRKASLSLLSSHRQPLVTGKTTFALRYLYCNVTGRLPYHCYHPFTLSYLYCNITGRLPYHCYHNFTLSYLYCNMTGRLPYHCYHLFTLSYLYCNMTGRLPPYHCYRPFTLSYLCCNMTGRLPYHCYHHTDNLW